MISFELSEEQEIVQNMIGQFATAVLRPESRRLDTDSKIDGALRQSLWELEIVQSQLDPACSALTNAIILEKLASGDASVSLTMATLIGFVRAVALQGSEMQSAMVREWLTTPNFRMSALATMEPSFGFDAWNFRTVATRRGDQYEVSGTKIMVPLAGECSYFLVMASCDDGPAGFIIPASSPGVTVVPPKGTLGLRAAELSEVVFREVAVPVTMRLGERESTSVQRILDSSRIGAASILAGIGQSVLDYVIPYTKERIVHGTPLAQKQKIAFDIADMRMDVESMRWMNWRAAWEFDTGSSPTRSAQLAFTYAASQSMQIADNGVQAFGGHGYVRAHPIELWYRDTRSLSLLEGALGV